MKNPTKALKKENTYKVETIVKILTYCTGSISFALLFGKISYSAYFFAFSLFLTSIYLEYKNIYIKRFFINLFALILIISKLYEISLKDFLQPSLEIMLFLLSFKFLEKKAFRDYMQIYLLSILILAGTTLISLDIVFLLYLLFYIFLLNSSLILLTYASQEKNIVLPEKTFIKIFLKTGILPLLAIPFTILFFIILPRTDLNIFNLLNKSTKAKTGFSNNVKLGEVSEIQEDDTIVFRVKTKKLENNLLYWRGITLAYFDGKTWSSIPLKEKREKISLNGEIIEQTIYLEPYEDRYLFGLDKPYKIYLDSPFITLVNKKDFTFYLSTPIFSRIRYRVFSVLTDMIPEKKIDEKIYLQVPETISPKIKELAKNLKGKTEEETVDKIFKFLKYGEFKYSLKNLPLSKSPLEDFLFKYKRGNCEYFASSMAILLRLNNIPARLVAGYKGGFYNELAKYYLIRQSDAHIWVEVFIKNRGWVRYDPTPYSIYQKTPQNLWSKLHLFLETINYYYINFVINYNLEKQIALIKKISNLTKIFNPQNIISSLNKPLLFFFLGIGIALFSLIILYFKYFSEKEKLKAEKKLISEFLKLLEKKGYKKREEEGLEEFVSKIREKELKIRAENFVKLFENIYYKDKIFSSKDIKELKKILEELKTFSKTS